MKKHLLLIPFLFLSLNIFSQMTLVPGQPNVSLYFNKSVKANENIGFAFYYPEENQSSIFVFANGLAEEITWEDTPSFFNPYYRGQLGDKYYFFSSFDNDSFLYEYDHISKNTRKIAFPEDYTCNGLKLLTDKLNGKIHLACGMSDNGDIGILSFDGTSFESFDSPQNFSIYRDDFLFVDSMDEIFIWYYEDGRHNNGAQLYSFDGTNLIHIPNPSNEVISGRYGVPFENHILLPYVTHVADEDYIYSLYKYENSNLVEIPGLPATVFHDIHFFSKEEKVYIALDNHDDYTSVLYEYDGNMLSEVLISPYYFPTFLIEFDGKDIFSLYDNTNNKAILNAYVEGSFEEVNVPEHPLYYNFAGILDSKLYLGAYHTRPPYDVTDLYSLTLGANEMESVPSLPEDTNYRYFQRKPNNNFLIHILGENEENTLYAQNTDENFQRLDPDNLVLVQFEFQLGEKVYYSYRDNDWVSKMYVWDGVLSTPDFNQSQNDITIHPNPATGFILVDVPNNLMSENLEVNLFSIDGKMISKQEFKNTGSQIEISLENLVKGIYILELKTISATIRKKLVKN